VAYQDALKSKLDDLYSTAGAAVSDLSGVVAGADVLASQFADVKNALQDLQDLADGLRSGYAYTPTGVVVPFAGSDANKPPGGWLVCNGASLSTSSYPNLFAVIGYEFGGSGANFSLPDLQGRTIIGVGAATSGATLTGVLAGVQGVNGGSTSLTTSHLPSHRHTINHDHAPFATTDSAGSHRHNVRWRNNVMPTSGSADVLVPASTGLGAIVGSAEFPDAGAHNHTIDVPNFEGHSGYEGSGSSGVSAVQPSMGLNYIIKV